MNSSSGWYRVGFPQSAIRNFPHPLLNNSATGNPKSAISPGVIVSLAPLSLPVNRYVDLFAKAILEQNYVIREFRWHPMSLWKTNVVILHWPNEFFVTDGIWATAKSIIKLTAMRLSQSLWRTRFIWVAHNAVPHENKKSVPQLTRWFLRSVNGIIFLSTYSRDLIGEMYPESRGRHSLVTVIGHYRDAAVQPLKPSPIPSGEVKLISIGLVRPYKNLEALVDAARGLSGIQLLISGMVMDHDRSLGDALLAKTGQTKHITLDLRDSPMDDAKFETTVDSADAVVLPYRNILNSSAALFALSRNRPVLAPNMGSLPELRETVGSDWIYLYDGEFNQGVLVDFLAWMRRTKRGRVAPLDAYAWSRIGKDLGEFIELIRSA
jgi:beta-1,4-mannosyltransferase